MELKRPQNAGYPGRGHAISVIGHVALVKPRCYRRNDMIRNVYRITVGYELPYVMSESRLHSEVCGVNLGALPPFATSPH